MVAALLLARLSQFGIWDPSEIEIADLARRLAEGAKVVIPHWGPWLVSQGFKVLGVHEWSGRLPMALGGVATALLSYALVRRFSDQRAALYALAIAGTSPMLVLNARTMLGEAPTLALQAALVACGAYAVFGEHSSVRARIGWMLGMAALGVIAVAARGALLGALPGLLALTGAALLDGKLSVRSEDRAGRVLTSILSIATALLALQVALRAFADGAAPDPWLGGQPIGGEPPGFDAVIERVFHAFAPWSALAPLALAHLTAASAGEGAAARNERRLRLIAILWLGASYAALTLFLSRYGRTAATIPVTALAVAVALFLREVERTRSAHWPAAMGAALLAALLVRDYALYPASPLHALPLAEFSLPEVFNPALAWSIALGGFGACAVVALISEPSAARALDLRAPYRWLAEQWRRGFGYKLWLVALAAALVALLVFSALSWFTVPGVRLSTLGRKLGRALGFVPFALPVIVAAVQLALRGADALGGARCVPLLIAGIGVGGYTAQGFMPELSGHFSPREVYETYNALAAPSEPLIEYRVGARTAAYYAKGNAVEVDSQTALLTELARDKRSWVVFPAEELGAIDRAFRGRTHRHLFVADGRSAKVTLATNLPIRGRDDQNAISASVRREAPATIQFPTQANFEDRVALLGYDLVLPHEGYVGAGEHFEIIWYFKVIKATPGAHRIFVHVDDNTMRIHGDHDPVDGHYPVRMWDVGDVIVDRHKLEVPASYPGGDYTIYMGFYSGDTRLLVKEGPKDDANRVRAGVLRIR
ncbi:MAG TPA: glycosyltransferase family 39 protein [Polyangiales bacterium]|nr:glycosyltransferase family 39 protein [Polyangiales bacterium]